MIGEYNIDESLLDEALRRTGISDREAVLNYALQQLIQRSTHDLRDLPGTVEIDPDYDYKKLREGR
ncbi:MAG: type II toxin-antitoxin system VapB family antitoxin [Candidatus Omnitrophica bacterium]|nr:type II toxin-antitoxin system VapB family antitoxin [Candidatus Omnitrophota bacterium]